MKTLGREPEVQAPTAAQNRAGYINADLDDPSSELVPSRYGMPVRESPDTPPSAPGYDRWWRSDNYPRHGWNHDNSGPATPPGYYRSDSEAAGYLETVPGTPRNTVRFRRPDEEQALQAANDRHAAEYAARVLRAAIIATMPLPANSSALVPIIVGDIPESHLFALIFNTVLFILALYIAH